MAGPALDRVLQRVTGLKAAAGGWVAKCPAHDDQIQSLQISEREDLSVGLHCHAGCEKMNVLSAMGLTFPDLFSSQDEEIVATYDYRDIDGVLLYQAVRFYPKAFKQRRPDGAKKGGWTWDMLPFKGKHVPYRLPELKGQNVVVIVEGEKDADRLWKLGIAATTNVGGAKKWTSNDSKWLAKAGVQRAIIIADNDLTGKQHRDLVATSVKQQNMAVSPLDLPDLAEHGDVSDWLSNGGSKEALEALIAAKPYVVAQTPPAPVIINPAPAVPEPEPIPEPDALATPTGYNDTQTGAAEAFVARFGYKLRYDHSRAQWFVWDGTFWRPDSDEAIIRLGIDHAKRWSHEVISEPDWASRKKWQDFTRRLERRAELIAMITTARAFHPITVGDNQWDTNPWLLGVPNGIINLQTGQLQPGNPTDFISQQASVPYEHAECPRWMQFLDEVFNGDTSLINFVHRAVGYSLTGDMREQCFFLATGGGSNGKSIFLSTLEALAGTYGQRATMKLFVGDASDFHMAELMGVRLVLASETKPGLRINEHIIKSLTGGESQMAERKHQHPFKFKPIGKIWLGMNELPKVVDDSYGFWRRVRLVPFNQTFSGSTDDKMLKEKLLAELPGILAWAVAGALAWQQDGLVPPKAVMAATDDYQNAEDPLVEFIAERCKYDPTGEATFSALFAAYNGWAESQKIPRGDRLTRRGIGIHLKRRFTPKETTDGSRKYLGVVLKQTQADNLYD